MSMLSGSPCHSFFRNMAENVTFSVEASPDSLVPASADPPEEAVDDGPEQAARERARQTANSALRILFIQITSFLPNI